jgi:hypothetical protein
VGAPEPDVYGYVEVHAKCESEARAEHEGTFSIYFGLIELEREGERAKFERALVRVVEAV